MIEHDELQEEQLRQLLRAGKLRFAGNKRLNIYGRLNCYSGKKMLKANRVFFESKAEAVNAGYRPCSHCLRKTYLDWKVRSHKH